MVGIYFARLSGKHQIVMRNLCLLSKILAISALLTVFSPIIMPAESLPTLPASDKIKTGTLANGVAYYIVTNPTHKGTADIALVQKAGLDDEQWNRKGESTVQAMSSLTDLQHFSVPGTSPFSFLRNNSVRPRTEGYVEVTPDATIFRFRDLIKAGRPEIIDSTLLFVFDIIAKDNSPVEDLYAPARQAIVISGDIDAGTLVGKMEMLSMLVSKKKGTPKETQYRWVDSKRSVKMVHSWTDNAIEVRFRSPRTPVEDMATVLPLVSSRYAHELGLVLRRRLSAALSDRGIPYSGIDFSYSSGAARSGDEIISIGIRTSEKYLGEATEILAGVLSVLDGYGVSPKEYAEVQNEISLNFHMQYGSPVVENAVYVDKCIASFLYGASLADDNTNLDFFLNRNMDSAQAAALFNNYVMALIDGDCNLTVRCTANTYKVSEEDVDKLFAQSWREASKKKFHALPEADTTKLRKSSGKLKVKSESAEPLFGGTLITYANGIRVIYRQTPAKGMFNFAWLLKGGYGSIADLGPGEGAYMKDMFGLYNVGGMSGDEFARMLRGNGVSMDADVSLSGFALTGCAQSGKLQLLMKAILTLSSERRLDRKAYAYYRRCQELQSHGKDIYSKVDSIMAKDLTYTEFKREGVLTDGFPERADKYFDGVFGRMNDGVLIIVGDVPEAYVRKTMSQYLGSFRTDRAFTYRSRLKDNRISGRKTVSVWDREPQIGLALYAPINYTAENYMAAAVAAMAMEEAISQAVAPSGWAIAESQNKVSLFPDEGLNMSIVLSKVNPAGMPASMAFEDSADVVLGKVRSAVASVGTTGISDYALKAGKKIVSNYYDSWKGDPKTIGSILALRYSYGKDIFSQYEAKIAAVTPDKVNPILKDLSKGGMAEYVVRKRAVQDFTEAKVEAFEQPSVPAMLPAEGQLVYPFEGMRVPLDTLDLRELEFLPAYVPEPEETSDGVAEDGSAPEGAGDVAPESGAAVELEGTAAAAAEDDGAEGGPDADGEGVDDAAPDGAAAEGEEVSEGGAEDAAGENAADGGGAGDGLQNQGAEE